jgi:hypothetical protein
VEVWVARGSEAVAVADARGAEGTAPPWLVVVERHGGDGYEAHVAAGGSAASGGDAGLVLGIAPALELAVPLGLLGAAPGDALRLRVHLDEEGRGRETVPSSGALLLRVPAAR